MSTTNGKTDTTVRQGMNGSSGASILEGAPNIFALGVVDVKADAYAVMALDIKTEYEEDLLAAAHEQYVAIEVHAALGRLVDTRSTELGLHAVSAFTEMVEDMAAIEAASSPGKYGNIVQNFVVQTITSTGQGMMQTGAITKQLMHRELVQPLAPHKPEPKPEPRKGFLAALFGG